MDMSLDEIIKSNKATKARSEAGSSVSQQKRGSCMNRGSAFSRAPRSTRGGRGGSTHGGSKRGGWGAPWQRTQPQMFRGRGRAMFLPSFATRRANTRGFGRGAGPGFGRGFMRGGQRGSMRGGQRGFGLVNRRGYGRFRGRGDGYVQRGGFGFKISNYAQIPNDNFSNAGSQRSGMPPYRQYNNQRYVNLYHQNRLPVHQRLGWMTPAQQIARNRLFKARQFLNMRQNQFGYQPQFANFNNYPNFNQHQMYKQNHVLQYQQKMRKATYVRNNGRTSPTGSEISVSIQNEMAMVPQLQYDNEEDLEDDAELQTLFIAPLSRRNVAQLPGGGQSSASAGPSNASASYRSGSNMSRPHPRRNQRNMQNRAYFAERQLPGTSTAAPSLASLRRKLAPQVDADGFALPPPPVHAVRLDKKLQEKIRALQQQGAANRPNGPTPQDINCRFRLGCNPTQTSTSDRFAMLASLVHAPPEETPMA